MTREKEISKVASEYTENYGYFNVDLDDVECGFMDGAKWADEHSKSPWHSIADGDLPPNNTYCLFPSSIEGFEVGYVQNEYVHFNNIEKPYSFKDIKYWMEIPELPYD